MDGGCKDGQRPGLASAQPQQRDAAAYGTRRKGSAMSQLVFRCPKTCNILKAGVDTDAPSLARVWDRAMRVYCPYCKETH